MLAIRKLQEERQEWEAEKEQFEENQAWQESELARLQAEVARLRDASPAAPGAPAQQVELSAPVQAHHEQQVKLLQTIDGLRRELQQERERGQNLERRLHSAGDVERPDTPAAASPLDATMASALRPVPPPEEFANLEDENLSLREQLNASKEKVIELKKAAAKRSADWRAELQTITEELGAKHALEEEAANLRQDRGRLQEELLNSRQQVGHLESAAKAEIERLRAELQQAQEKIREVSLQAKKADEMENLSQTMGRKVMELEQELSKKVNEQSRLLGLFLRHSEQPLEALRAGCRRLLGMLQLSVDSEEPARFVPSVDNLQDSLVQVVTLLRFAEEVMEGLKTFQASRSGYGR